MPGPLSRLLEGLVRWQLTRPWWVVGVVLSSLLPAWLLARTLELRTGFSELLPEDKPSVVELRRVSQRLASASALIVVAEGERTEVLRRFVDEVAPQIRKLPPELVTDVDDGPGEALDFFDRHKWLYADLADLQALHDDVVDRYDWEVGRQLGTNLDDDDPPPALDAATVEARFRKRSGPTGLNVDSKPADGALSTEAPSPAAPGDERYYLGEGGRLIVMVVRSPLGATDERAFALQERIRALAAAGNYTALDPSFRVAFTGNLVTSAEQFRAVSGDLVNIGAAGVGFVLLVVFLFFLRLRVLAALGLTIGTGLLWTFAFAELTVGHLNTATGFLVSVVAGNGINATVIFMARTLEARREGLDCEGALRTALRDTWSGTLSVVGVAMLSYGALMTTDFRGFRHFGVIGGAGMLLCWLATYLLLPSVVVLFERWRPFPEVPTWRERLAALYARPFVWLARRFATPLAVFGVVSAVVAGVAAVTYFAGDPMEYDLRKTRNDDQEPTAAGRLAGRVNPIIGRMSQGGRALLCERLDQVEPLVAELVRRRDEAPPEARPFDQVVSIFSLMPTDQEKKVVLMRTILDRIERAKARGFLTEEKAKELEPHLPREVRALTLADLPALVARPFEEKDGTRGTVVYVSPTRGKSLYDADYLLRWAEAFREVRLPNGEVVRGTGDAVVFSDMLLAINEAAPRILLLAFLGSVLVILLSFRGRRAGWAALATLLLGVTWMVAVLYAAGVKLNFLNFVALPIAIGVGSDYAINVMKRYEIEGDAGIERAFRETGGAVVACSFTTLSGYAALLLSVNGAVRSFGFAAATGELMTQLAAMLVLPATLYSLSRRSARARR